MNCCDDYGQRRQGDNCPARVAKVSRRDRAPEPLPPSTWRDSLKHAARWALLCLAVVLLVTVVVGVSRA